MKASKLSFRVAVVFAIAGFVMGIAMAATGNHSVMPAHAHLNLLGWVSMFLFGIYYRLHPSLDERPAARVQIAVWTVGTIVLTIGVATYYLGHPNGQPAAAAGSIVVFGSLLHFATLVFRQGEAGAPEVGWAREPGL